MKNLIVLIFLIFSFRLFAELKPGTTAPDFPKNAIWLNGQSYSFKKALKGKVVLVDFWEYTCINCIRTFPHLKELYKRYHKYGLEIIGVHKGEFAFASVEKNVAEAYRRFKLPYPSIADINDKVWNLYDCNTWPDSYLIGRDGVIKELHQGEGEYSELEKKIRELLKVNHPNLDFSNIEVPPEKRLFDPECGDQSEEIYIGYSRGSSWGGEIANKEGFKNDKIVDYQPTSKRVKRGFFVEGKWLNGSDAFKSISPYSSNNKVELGITYIGRDVYSVLGRSSDNPVEIIVTRDGEPVPEKNRGKDIFVDKNGQTLIKIDKPKMYYVITKEDDNNHTLRFFPKSAGAQIYSFTFGNKCLQNFDRL